MTSANSLYTWDQTIESVTVSIAVPSGTRGRDIAVDMSGSRLRAGLRGEPPMVDGELYGRIKTADSLWQLEGGVVEITMEKVDLQFWQTLMAVNPDVSASESGLDPRALFEAAYVAETKQSWAKALDFYQASADAGFAPAQLKLATMFEHGKETTGFDIEQDYAKAIELYTKAGEQGSPHAQLHLGQAYEDGKLGLPKNLAKAVEWLEKVQDETSLASASFHLGLCYESGDANLPADPVRAVTYWKLAAERGFARAFFNLGVMSMNGSGTVRDLVAARTYFAEANRRNAELRVPENELQLAEKAMAEQQSAARMSSAKPAKPTVAGQTKPAADVASWLPVALAGAALAGVLYLKYTASR